MAKNSFYILSCGFALFTLISAFSFQSLTPEPWPLIPALSTTVVSALQIHPFLKTKPISEKVK
jgi:hypothetical protein